MNSDTLLIIANPEAGAHAGRVNRNRLLEVAQKEFERGGLKVEMCFETSRESVVLQAQRGAAQGYRAIVAAGGDGTINAIVNGMMQVRDESPDSTVPLGVLPMGTGNVFAFNMGIKTWREACRVIRLGHTRAVDVGCASLPDGMRKQHFLLMAGIGFDAQVVENTSLRLKYVLRDFAYVLKTLENVVLHRGTDVTLKLDGGKAVNGHFWQVMVGNVASYAWAIRFTQNAQLDDGFIDVCAMPYHNKVASVQQAMQILTGQHVARGVAKYFKTKTVEIESTPPVPVQLDGDEWGQTPVKLGVAAGALRVLAAQDKA
ncbi:MAG TPA: diacylglycerol kinase family protein [Abditibacteriaceae bacterium]|jgi:YegS/Rv2252/BmrU family lipid kinase